MIDPRLNTLRVLRAHGTVTATAQALHLTPSTVSQQLKQLAHENGIRLLEPHGRRVRLTPAAEVLLEHADVMYAQWERAKEDLAALEAGQMGDLRLCGLSSTVSAFIAPAAKRLREAHPGVRLHLAAVESDEAFRMLESGEADIAVINPTDATPPPSDRRFEQRFLVDDVEDLLVSVDHRFAGRESVSMAETADEEWVSTPGCVDQEKLLLASAADAGFTPDIAHRSDSFYSTSGLVCTGFGVSLFSRLAPLPPEHSVVRVPIHGRPTPTRRMFTAVRGGSARQPAIARGLAAIRAEATREHPDTTRP
ncbi:MAG TPA: LysR family transcriptional regulator [Stackebrandtia sp.]|jgi:DNA-binding transcriptional LysR family regulator|uniref:LysR family transcriptional regulator n=1 Tax=Stackebrandtia sp. TaxID=2023065 RepID=UPI002D508EFF|nr:LysR family transcriptional regulator [Stackebrandtia sp.]HZE38035.1 LysR family transcriptional regulator [Stackebrandtia sp.]